MIKAMLHDDGSPHEGDSVWKIATVMRRLGYNEGLTFHVATVERGMPDLAIRLNDMPFDLSEAEGDLIVLDHLKQHTQRMAINGAAPVDVVVGSPLKVGGHVLVAQSESQQSYYVLGTI